MIPQPEPRNTHRHRHTAHTRAHPQRRAGWDGQARSGRRAVHSGSDPAGNRIVTAFPSERPARSFQSLTLSRPAGARQHQHRPLHRQRAPAFEELPRDHTARRPTEEVKPSASGRSPGPTWLLVPAPGTAPTPVRASVASWEVRRWQHGPRRGHSVRPRPPRARASPKQRGPPER